MRIPPSVRRAVRRAISAGMTQKDMEKGILSLERLIGYPIWPSVDPAAFAAHPRFREAPVLLTAGEWSISATQASQYDEQVFIGTGYHTVWKQNGSPGTILNITHDKCVVWGIRFVMTSGSRALFASGADNLVIENCWFDVGASTNAIRIESCNRLTIKNCFVVSHSGVDAIYVKTSNDGLISSNHVLSTGSGYEINLDNNDSNRCAAVGNVLGTAGQMRHNTGGAHQLAGNSPFGYAVPY